MVRLKKPLLAGAFFLGAAIGLQATPVCPQAGTYDQLQSLGTCAIGDLTLSGFTFRDSAVNAVAIPETALTFSRVNRWPPEIGFLFGMGAANDLGIPTTAGSNSGEADETAAAADHVNFAQAGTDSVLNDINDLEGGNFTSFYDTVSEMNPVPEPGFYGVLAAGMGAVFIFARRRKKSV